MRRPSRGDIPERVIEGEAVVPRQALAQAGELIVYIAVLVKKQPKWVVSPRWAIIV